MAGLSGCRTGVANTCPNFPCSREVIEGLLRAGRSCTGSHVLQSNRTAELAGTTIKGARTDRCRLCPGTRGRPRNRRRGYWPR